MVPRPTPPPIRCTAPPSPAYPLGCCPPCAWLPPPDQRPPGAVTSVQPSILRGGRGEQEEREPLRVSWEGHLCPSPPAAPAGPASCGLPGTGRPGSPSTGAAAPGQGGRLFPARAPVPSEGAVAVRTSRGGPGSGGALPAHGTAALLGAAGRRGPAPGLVQRGQVRSLQCPLPPLERVPGHVWGPSGFTHLGLRAQARLLPARPAGPLRHRGGGRVLLCAATPEPVRRGEECQGQRAAGGERSLPSPVTGTDLIYLFWLKKKNKTTLHCIWLDP